MIEVWQLEEWLHGWGSEHMDRVWSFATKEEAKRFIELRRLGGYHFEYVLRPTYVWEKAEDLEADLCEKDEW